MKRGKSDSKQYAADHLLKNKWIPKEFESPRHGTYYQNTRHVLYLPEGSTDYDMYYVISKTNWKYIGRVTGKPYDIPVLMCTVNDILYSKYFVPAEREAEQLRLSANNGNRNKTQCVKQ